MEHRVWGRHPQQIRCCGASTMQSPGNKLLPSRRVGMAKGLTIRDGPRLEGALRIARPGNWIYMLASFQYSYSKRIFRWRGSIEEREEEK